MPSITGTSAGRLAKGLALLGAAALVGACLGPSAIITPTLTPTTTVPTATFTPEPTSTPTPIPPSPTPQLPVITAGNAGGLSIFMTFGQGETSRSLAFSPDSTTLAETAGNTSDFAIRLWEVPSGQALTTLSGHQAIVYQVAFSPNGAMLASASKDGTARIWDWRTGTLLYSLAFVDEVTSVEFSNDSGILAVGGVDGWPDAAVWTYTVSPSQPLLKMEAAWNIPDMDYSPDGQRLVGGGTSRLVHIWRVSDGEELKVLHHAGQVTSIAISPDGSTVATGLCVESTDDFQCTLGGIWLWDLQTGILVEQLEDFPEFVEGVAFSPDGSVLFGGSRDGTLRAYATSDYETLLQAFTPGGILDLAIAPDGRLLATGRWNGQIDLWRIAP